MTNDTNEFEFDYEYDFAKLGYDDSGINFQDHDQVIELTQKILKIQYDLDVEFNTKPGHLIPRIANRVAYLSFVNRYLLGPGPGGRCIVDIGTGPYAIYLILAARLMNSSSRSNSHGLEYTFIGVDIDDAVVENAKRVIKENGLSQLIDIQQLALPQLPEVKPNIHTVAICNPPFYTSLTELKQATANKLTPARTTELIASELELVYPDGGEIGFVTQLIEASVGQSTRYKWYTSLLGKYSSIKPILQKLKTAYGITNYLVCKLMPDKRNRTQRWIICWSFEPERVKLSPNLAIVDPNVSKITSKLSSDGYMQKLCESLDQLQLEYTVGEDGDVVTVTIYKDVWSRKYRRTKGLSTFNTNEVSSVERIRVRIEPKVRLAYWEYGLNAELFLSFTNFLRSI